MSFAPLVAHSLAEAYFYLMATPCAACGAGPLKGGEATGQRRVGDAPTVSIHAQCACCAARHAFVFALPEGTGLADPSGTADVNPTDEPSRLLDVAQWITLAHVIIEAAGRQTDKGQARRLGIEAAQCLEEALKFYEDGNDLPPSRALFHDSSRVRLKESPHLFSRQRLIEMRRKLPSLATMRTRLAPPPAKRSWWARWRSS